MNYMMIIERMDVFIVEAPLVTPFRIATGQHNTLENVFIRLDLAGGVTGYGEAAVATHITGETVAKTTKNLKAASRVCLGKDISDYRRFLAGLRDMFSGNHAGLAAVEMATLDAWTRSGGIPFWKLFGKRPKPLVSDITIVIGTIEEAARSARDYSRRGFKTFKIKVGKDVDADIERLIAVKKAAPRARMIVDANQGFTAEATLEFLNELKAEDIRVSLVEQPVPKGDWDGLKKVTLGLAKSGIKVCADESVSSLADVKKAIRTKAVTAVNVKCMKSGILEGEAIARKAREAGMELMIGAMMESSLSITASAHFASGLGGVKFVDLDTTYFLKGPLSRSPYLDTKGLFDFRFSGAGIGVVPKL